MLPFILFDLNFFVFYKFNDERPVSVYLCIKLIEFIHFRPLHKLKRNYNIYPRSFRLASLIESYEKLIASTVFQKVNGDELTLIRSHTSRLLNSFQNCGKSY